jgi:hypothetical protein
VVDHCNHRLVLWHLDDGSVWKYLGDSTLGKSLGSQPPAGHHVFIYPQAVAVTADGALVVSDARRVQVLTMDGAVLCVLAGGGQLMMGDYLLGVAVCTGTNEILVTDFKNHRVLALTCTANWSALLEIRAWGCQGSQFGQLDHPIGIVFNGVAGGAWISDKNNHRLCFIS